MLLSPSRPRIDLSRHLPLAVGAVASLILSFVAADALTSPPTPAPSRAAAAQADCLWYAARNHGFLGLQREAVRAHVEGRPYGADEGPSLDRARWDGFVSTIGARECEFSASDTGELLAALARTADDADRLLLGRVR